MSTDARHAAAAIYRSEEVCPFRPATPAEMTASPQDPQKERHYANLGRLITTLTHDVLWANDEMPD